MQYDKFFNKTFLQFYNKKNLKKKQFQKILILNNCKNVFLI